MENSNRILILLIKRMPDTSKRAAKQSISHNESNTSDEKHFQEEKSVPATKARTCTL